MKELKCIKCGKILTKNNMNKTYLIYIKGEENHFALEYKDGKIVEEGDMPIKEAMVIYFNTITCLTKNQ